MSEALLWLISLVTVVIAVLAAVLRVRVSRAFQGAPARGAVSLPAEGFLRWPCRQAELPLPPRQSAELQPRADPRGEKNR